MTSSLSACVMVFLLLLLIFFRKLPIYETTTFPDYLQSNFYEKMSEKRFYPYETLIQDYVESTENRNTRGKTKRGGQLFEEFLRKEKSVEREEHTIAAEQLN